MKYLANYLPQLHSKRVLVRCNYDVPIEDGKVVDTTRIEDSIATIKALLEQNCQIVLLAHYDRPEGKFDQEKSLKPVVSELEKLLGHQVAFEAFDTNLHNLSINPEDQVTLIENLRFWPGEEANDSNFAQLIANLGEIYVNECFAVCHREHASMVGLPKLLPSYAGIALEKELEIIKKIKADPDQPLVVVIGGAKLETKEPLVKAFTPVAHKILVGGKLALDFRNHHEQLPENVILAEVEAHGKDITVASANSFAEMIMSAKTVVWNGAMGVFEEDAYQQGTKIIAQAVNSTPAFTLVGGGDTETALTEFDLQDNINHISSGGGAMLTLLSQPSLPAIEALE